MSDLNDDEIQKQAEAIMDSLMASREAAIGKPRPARMPNREGPGGMAPMPLLEGKGGMAEMPEALEPSKRKGSSAWMPSVYSAEAEEKYGDLELDQIQRESSKRTAAMDPSTADQNFAPGAADARRFRPDVDDPAASLDYVATRNGRYNRQEDTRLQPKPASPKPELVAKAKGLLQRVQGRRPGAETAAAPVRPVEAAEAPSGPPRTRRPLIPSESSAAFESGAPAPKQPDGDEEMRNAQRTAANNRTGRALGQAGRIIGRAGLEKPAHWKEMDAQAMERADAPVQDLLTQRGESRKQSAEARAQDDQRMQREDQGNQNTALALQEEDQGFQREEIGRTRDYHDKGSRLGLTRRAMLMTMYPREAKQLIAAGKFEDLSAADVDVYLKELDNKAGRSSASSGLAIQKELLRRADKLAKETSSKPFGEARAIFDSLDQISPGITSGQEPGPGFDYGTRERVADGAPWGLGSGLLSEEQTELRNGVSQLRDLIGRMRSGAVLNASEEAFYKKMIADEVFSTPAKLAQGIMQVRQGLEAKLRDTQASYGVGLPGEQSPLELYEGQGGTSYRQQPKGAMRQPAAPRRRKDKNGVIWEEQADGSAKRVE